MSVALQDVSCTEHGQAYNTVGIRLVAHDVPLRGLLTLARLGLSTARHALRLIS